MQDIKRIIRESEAVAGIEVMGLSRDHARFLNLPFYQTGKVKKDPIGPADVKIMRELLEEYRPEIIFVAGDLSDPHGTHRMCKEAIDKALAESTAPRPEVWLYRGAWQEWAVTDADVARADVAGGAAHQDPGDLQAPDRRRTRRPSPARTTASSGSGSMRATRTPRRCSIGWGWPNTSRWKRTSSNRGGR